MHLPLVCANVQLLAWYLAGTLKADLQIVPMSNRDPKLLMRFYRERPASAGSSVGSSATAPAAAARGRWGPGKALLHIML